MQFQVLFPVIGLLEEDIRADARRLQLPVGVHVRRGDIDIHTADGVPSLPDGIDGPDGLQDIFQRTVPRVLAGFQREALVPGADEGPDLRLDFLLAEFLARNGPVLRVIRTIDTTVYAVIG